MASQAFVEVVADTSGVAGQMRRDMTVAIREVEATLPDIEVDVEINGEGLRRDINGRLRDARGRFVTEGRRSGEGFGFGLRDGASPGLATFAGQLNLAVSRIALLGSAAAASLPAVTAGIGGIVAATQRLVNQFGGFNGILNQTLGLAGVAAVSALTLKVALVGVSDAFKALTGPADDFNEALKALSPQAQRVFTELRSGVPVLHQFQQALQDALFRQIARGDVTKLLSGLKELRPAASALAEAFGHVADNFIKWLSRGNTLDNLNTLLKAAAPLVKSIGDNLLQLADVALNRAADGTKLFGQSFTALKAIFDTIKGVVTDVGRIFAALGTAAQTAGTSIGGPLATGLGLVATLLESAPGQAFLVTLNQFASTIASALLPVLGALLAALAPVVQALATALTPILNTLSPIMVNLANAIGQVLLALIPLLAPLSQLVVAILPILNPLIAAAASLMTSLAPVVVALANAVAAFLVPILDQLPMLLNQILLPITQLVAAVLPQFTAAIIQLTPSLVLLAQAIADNIESIIPLIPSIVTLAAQFIGLTLAVLPILPKLVQLATLAINLATAFNQTLGAAITFVAGLFRGLGTTFSSVSKTISGVITSIVTAFVRLKQGITTNINSALTVIRGLPGRARSALGNIGSILYNSGAALIRGFINGIKSQIGSMVSAITSAVGKARALFPFSPAKEGPFSGRGYTTYSGAALIEGFIEGIRSATPALQTSLTKALGMAQVSLAPAGAAPATMGAGTPAQSLAHDIAGGVSITPAAPVVQVMIGNRVINDHVKVLIQKNNQLRDRTTAQGVRR